MKINWLVRIRNKNFWLSIIPALLMLSQVVVSFFGIDIEMGDIASKLTQLTNAVFVVLIITGIVNDPTTKGMDDSSLAMTYDSPKK